MVTHVVATQGFCHVVPNARDFEGYKVTCDGSGGGFIEFCDRGCNNCPIRENVANADQCVANDYARFGNRGYRVQCPARGTGDIAVGPIQQLANNAVEINWFEAGDCGAAENFKPFHRTIVVPVQGLCQRVPNAPGNEGYRVLCNADGSGIYQTCTDANCEVCTTTAPFRSEQCLANPIQYGSASVAFRCPGTPPAELVPFRPA